MPGATSSWAAPPSSQPRLDGLTQDYFLPVTSPAGASLYPCLHDLGNLGSRSFPGPIEPHRAILDARRYYTIPCRYSRLSKLLRMKDYLPLVVAVIAAATALSGYLINSAAGRRTDRARRYAEALDAIERYRQLPYSFLRLHNGTTEMRIELARMLGEVQVSLALYRRWLALESPELGAAYDAVVDKIREQNSGFRRDALSRPIADEDLAIEIDRPYKFDDRPQRAELLRIMRKHLALSRNLM
jgi:hypothetical protein